MNFSSLLANIIDVNMMSDHIARIFFFVILILNHIDINNIGT